MKLQYMPYAQAHVHSWNGATILTSYNTDVAFLRDGWLYVNGLYSATTRRHIMAFIKEYVPIFANDFQLIKKLVHDHLEINVETGEIREVF